MEIKLERDEKGRVIAVDKDSNKEVGKVVTMGDMIGKEKEKKASDKNE